MRGHFAEATLQCFELRQIPINFKNATITEGLL
jgi:hypothetical protein